MGKYILATCFTVISLSSRICPRKVSYNLVEYFFQSPDRAVVRVLAMNHCSRLGRYTDSKTKHHTFDYFVCFSVEKKMLEKLVNFLEGKTGH